MSEQDWNDLQKTFPCRATQIRDIFVLYKAAALPLAPLYLYGLPSTGKKSVISLCLEALNKRKVEIDCFLCPSERALYESILNRLSNHIPSRANGYQSWKRTEKVADFIRHFNEVPCKEPTYLILLHADALVSICPKALVVLLELDKYSTCHWVHVTLTAYLPWERLKSHFLSFHNVTTPYLIWFPNYQWNECAIILENMLQTDPKYEKLKKPFVRTVLDVLYHAIPYLDQLFTVCQQLFQIYIQPAEGVHSASIHDASKLYSNILPYLRQRLDGMYCHQRIIDRNEVQQPKSLADTGFADEYYLPLSNTAKLLCIAAYMAAHISPKRDSKIFTKRTTFSKRRGRKNNHSTQILQDIPFSFERLLAIYRIIQRHLEHSTTESHSSGVLLIEWKTICDYNFVIPLRTDSLTNPKYHSQVTEETFHAFTRQLGIQLAPYLGLS
ncbi:hypothetical protein GpartN1_g6853.t1 [Galdieria partita]|uniref:Origin recognition complex subunit 5 C-terminal domain-containing protein n=1 Tax=Galdieria partita TaxID=83374 RepID=A0A9C7Q3R8_9RHOD|nr:hypothetical protein GpartN1_g6853.t1 [Galdieria partita]